jgi:hypothetical protein
VARIAGVSLHVDGRDLVLEASAPPPAAVLDLLKCHKAGVIALLRASDKDWPPEEWRAFYDERAGIAQYNGGLPRASAEALAHACCVSEWLNRTPVNSPNGHCLGCGESEHDHDLLLPFGTETTGHAWLHQRCWEAWRTRRNAEAAAALADMGIEQGTCHQ